MRLKNYFKFERLHNGDIKVWWGQDLQPALMNLRLVGTVPKHAAIHFMQKAQSKLDMLNNDLWVEPDNWLEELEQDVG